jgi:DNA transformation protein
MRSEEERFDMNAIDRMRNIRPVSATWLQAVGIKSLADLSRVGAIDAFRAVEAAGFRPSLNLLYALEGAILDVDWRALSLGERAELREALGR